MLEESCSSDFNSTAVVIGVNGPAVVPGQPPEVSRMDETNAPNRATEKPGEESFSSPGVEWAVNEKARKPRNPPRGKVCFQMIFQSLQSSKQMSAVEFSYRESLLKGIVPPN